MKMYGEWSILPNKTYALIVARLPFHLCGEHKQPRFSCQMASTHIIHESMSRFVSVLFHEHKK